MKKQITLSFLCMLFVCSAQSQTRYLVRFKDKGTSPFSFTNPLQYLNQRAIDRRTRYNIAIDSFDLPVTPRYVDSIRDAGVVTILNTSKWLNEVAIRTTDPVALAKISTFPFVLSTTPIASFGSGQTPVNKIMDSESGPVGPDAPSFIGGTQADFFNYGKSHGQVHLHQGEFLHNHGFKGETMRLAVLDGGFFHYQTLPTFDSIRINNQILDTWDFVQNNNSVNEDDTHGMWCLSTISANIPGIFVGTSPKANVCLFRTEDVGSEYKIEEHNLSAGFERSDSMGVDVCSVSLGYNRFDDASQNYTYANMNGDFTISAIAADLAAKKGLLPVVAAGNEGNGSWHFIVTPGDADSTLTVAAVDTLTNIAGFSGYGPSADGRVKPNLAAVGLNAVIANATTGQPVYGNGTSFATPNLAGLTTCLWQAFPEFNNMAIIDAMQRAATRFTNPNDRIGYGIPDMKKAFAILLKKSYVQSAAVSGCSATVNFTVKNDNTMQVVVERKQSSQLVYSTLQTIPGTGSFSNKNLSFTDDLTLLSSGGTVMYRLRLDIAADTSFYLDSITVNVPEICVKPVNDVAVTPNPVTTSANIIISRATPATIGLVLLNAAGQKVYEFSYPQAIGSQIRTINMESFAKGLYFLTVYADGKKTVTKRILKR